jgi:hypothetical protein
LGGISHKKVSKMMSIEEIERFIRMCTYVDPDTLSVGGVRRAAEGIANAIAAQQIAPAEAANEPRYHGFACPECGRLGQVKCEPPLR